MPRRGGGGGGGGGGGTGGGGDGGGGGGADAVGSGDGVSCQGNPDTTWGSHGTSPGIVMVPEIMMGLTASLR